MGKLAVVIGLLLLVAAPLATVEAADPKQAGQIADDIQETPDRATGLACDCCQKCKAARRPVAPKEKETPAKSNGCKGCCDRCGRAMPPDPDEIPPEIIDKEIPPRMKEMPRR